MLLGGKWLNFIINIKNYINVLYGFIYTSANFKLFRNSKILNCGFYFISLNHLYNRVCEMDAIKEQSPWKLTLLYIIYEF